MSGFQHRPHRDALQLRAQIVANHETGRRGRRALMSLARRIARANRTLQEKAAARRLRVTYSDITLSIGGVPFGGIHALSYDGA